MKLLNLEKNIIINIIIQKIMRHLGELTNYISKPKNTITKLRLKIEGNPIRKTFSRNRILVNDV